MFDRNFVEAMPACFVETASKPCLAMCHLHVMFSYVACLSHCRQVPPRASLLKDNASEFSSAGFDVLNVIVLNIGF